MKRVIDAITEIASKDFALDWEAGDNIFDASGGNYDDAYGIGLRDGEISLAKQLAALLKEEGLV
jgi:hypothetical protein